MHIYTYIQPETALRQGNTRAGWQSICVTDELLSTLSELERGVMSELVFIDDYDPGSKGTHNQDDLKYYPFGVFDWATLGKWIAITLIKRGTELHAYREELRAVTTTKKVAWSGNPDWPQPKNERERVALAEEQETAAAILWKVELQHDRENEERKDKHRAKLKQAETAKKRVEAQKLAEAHACDLALLVKLYGTPSMRSRLADGVLPRKEQRVFVAGHLFESLLRYVVFEPALHLKCTHAADCGHGYETEDDDDEFSAVVYDSDPATELTAEQHSLLIEIRNAAPNYTITPMLHHAECSMCHAETIRHAVLVSANWHGETYTRSYILPDDNSQVA